MTIKAFCRLVLLLCAIAAPQAIFAQSKVKTVEITHADRFIGERINGKDVRKLIGNVGFRQDDVNMNCDSAYFYEDRNAVNAWGHIHINHADSLHLYGETLEYDGNRKYAIVKKNVQLRDREMTLNTDRLDYDISKKIAFYTNGGTLTDSENRLTSKRGYYYGKSRDMYFRQDVELVNPQYLMNSDTLQYNIITRKAFFYGPTTIRSNSDLIYCETGWYNTLSNTAQFGKNAYLNSENQFLYGDSLYYDRRKGFGKAVGHIKVLDTSEHMLIEGAYAEHFQKKRQTFITRNVMVTKGFKDDSLYMTADTLRSGYDTSGKYRILKAYKRARMFNDEFQGMADSMVYSMVDSTIDFRQKPVFWFGEYQTTADRILVFTKKNNIHRVELYKNSFIINQEDSLRFGQVKGRDMVGYFKENKLSRVEVSGNGESIYYARDDKKAYIGMNKIVSSDIRIGIQDQQVSDITFKRLPDASLTPVKDVHPKEAKLSGFVWYGTDRPKSLDAFKEMIAKQVPPVPKVEAKKAAAPKTTKGKKKKK